MQHTSYVPGRVNWMRRTNPEDVQAQIAKWTDISTFIFTRWFGSTNVPASYSVSAWSGLLNRHELNWDAGMLDAIGLEPSNLPRLAPYSEGQSGLCPIYSMRWPQLVGCAFLFGGRRWRGGKHRIRMYRPTEHRSHRRNHSRDAFGSGPPGR